MASTQAWTDPRTLANIRQAREQLQLDQSKQTETTHRTVKDELPIIVEQYRTSVDVQTRLSETTQSIAQLQRDLQDVETLATPLLDLLRARSKHTAAKRTASVRLDILQRLHSRVAVLQRAEEQISSGTGRVDAVLELRAGKRESAYKIDGEVQARENKVIGASEAQLRDGFERAVRAFVGKETNLGELGLQKEVKLRVISLAEKSTTKLKYHTTSVSLRDLTTSLDAFGILDPLLNALQTQILKHLVKPLIQSHADGQPLAVQKHEDTAETRLVLVQSTDKDLWQSLAIVTETLHTFLSSPPSGSPETAIASFHRHVASDTLLTIRDGLLLPLLSQIRDATEPTSAVDAIVENVKIIEKATAFEESISKDSAHSLRLLRDFADSRAGNVYVGARKSWVLERVREIVGGKWGRWEGVVVQTERKLSGEDAKPETSGAVEKSALPTSQLAASETERADDNKVGNIVDQEEDGWDLDTPSIPPPAEQPAPNEIMNTETAEEDGWGFDDDDLTSTKAAETPEEPAPAPIVAPKPIRQARKIGKKAKLAVEDDDVSNTQVPETILLDPPKASPPPIVVPKPIRQARKVGKKAKSVANGTSEGSGTASPALGSSIERFTSPPVNPQEKPVQAEEQPSGWEMEWEEPVVEAPPLVDMSEHEIVRERMKVSVALDDVISIVIDELQFVSAFQQADITLKDFAATADRLATVPSETLELVRALVPVRYDGQIRDTPALAMQFSNDCAWLAERVRFVMDRAKGQGVAVDGLAKQVEKLMSLSTIVLDKQVEMQINTILDILADLEGLETTSDDSKYQKCTRAFEQVHHKLETLFQICKDVMKESLCLTSMGQLVDTAISHICTDILALVDITAEESERLKQLCTILRPIEARFNEMNVNVVAFVPHWLRFCYLSEIMEASLVDITYLFDSGALVDFTSDELVHLLLALFTDTPNRAELIGKIMSR